MSDLHDVIGSTKQSMKSAFQMMEWWAFVEKEVQDAIYLVIDDFETLGLPFRNAFRSMFELERRRRVLQNRAVEPQKFTILFGPKLSEESYQCGKVATIAALNLNDWSNPTEADVRACQHLCQQIDALENLKVFEVIKPRVETSPSFSPTGPLFGPKPHKGHPQITDSAKWDFDSEKP